MDKEKTIKKEVEELLGKLDVQAEVKVEKEDDVFNVQIKTVNDTALLIGRYGETLQSISKVLEAICFKLFLRKVNLLLNINDYRERQKERLEKIAENVAQRVLSEKKSAALRSFSPFERKIIHQYIGENHSQLTTYSEGEGYERRLIVEIKKSK